jgi:twitching motility protein PilT
MTRQILAGVLRGVISQRLMPRKSGGRVAAVEVMVNTARIADLIRDSKTDEITEAIEDGSFHLMQSFSQHLVKLVLADEVDFDTAAAAATNRHDFEIAVDQALRRKRVAEGVTEEPAAVEDPEPGEDDDEPVALRVAN